jgi:hypothetical protein
MGIMRCTGKLLNELGTKPAIAPDQPPSLSDWHANLLRLDHKKCVLFTNDQTLYSFLCRLVKPHSGDFGELFRLGLLTSLMSEGLDDRLVQRMLGRQGTTMMIAKTNSRSILGSMNDLAFQIKCTIHAIGGFANADLSEINRELNRVPMGAIKYNVGIEELKRRLVEPESGTTNPRSGT